MGHDQNFKNLILDYPRQALAFFAAEEAAAVDETARVTPIRQEQLQERLGERFRELDVPMLVEWPDGGREAILSTSILHWTIMKLWNIANVIPRKLPL